MTDQAHDPIDIAAEAAKAPPVPGRLLDHLEEIVSYVESAKSMPLSSNVVVSREELLGRLSDLQRELPEELRAARWMIRERESFVGRTNEKARETVARAEAKAAELVANSSIVAEATEEANVLTRNAEAESRHIRLQAEDYAEARLSEAETILGEMLDELRAARAKLHESRPAAPQVPVSE
ncbi:MAG: hypothetical protein KJP12_00345 [Acidimicrobiia bacterium]|nr:hypothetical protein [Acidimicrobiia bacterium]MBT8213645.1 hypothetical protein [Acidimicrobiia bacterium]NNF70337.1 hypothetical protein [Acidimicrobiia bacterium]NNK91731.1 hypothetical protein [Acidimicrobiia bacterium]